MEQTECSEMSAYKVQMPGNYPKEGIKHTEQGESLKLRIYYLVSQGYSTQIGTVLRWLDGQPWYCSSPNLLAGDQESFKRWQHPRRVEKMPALALVLDKCQYMGQLSAGLQQSAVQVSNLRHCRNYTRTILVHCDVRMISSVKNQQINQPALARFVWQSSIILEMEHRHFLMLRSTCKCQP